MLQWLNPFRFLDSPDPRHRRIIRVAAVLCLIGMFIGSHGPRIGALEDTVDIGRGSGGLPKDKVVHFLCFGLLTLLMGAGRFLGNNIRLNLLAATLLVSVYGAVDEITQGWMGRDCEFSDYLADFLAGVVNAAGTLADSGSDAGHSQLAGAVFLVRGSLLGDPSIVGDQQVETRAVQS